MSQRDEASIEAIVAAIRAAIEKMPPDSELTPRICKVRDGHLHLGRFRIVRDEPGIVR